MRTILFNSPGSPFPPAEEPDTPSGLYGLLLNGPLISAFFAFVAAQGAKIVTNYYSENVWDWKRLLGSGGMPSSHTAFVIGLTTAIAVRHGTGSPLFAVCAVISLIVMYDASGVRLHAGKQASALNLIISEFPADHPVQETGRLREALGHTHAQVTMGALVGIVIGFISEVAMGTG